MKSSHPIIFLIIIIDFQESPFVTKYLIESRLLVYIIHKELHKDSALTFLNDCVYQV